MLDDGARVSGGGIADLPTNEARGDRACECSATDVDGGTTGSVDPLSEGSSRALHSIHSSSLSMGAEATLDA
jgi:hypothetical protein